MLNNRVQYLFWKIHNKHNSEYEALMLNYACIGSSWLRQLLIVSSQRRIVTITKSIEALRLCSK